MTPANRLAHERSPYLLQHAHNPVDWYPWGDEAFDRARREDRPVFLSVGYSACHWCHVMERESFEDPATAAYLNAHYVSIKVDREERPDIDQVYQLAYQVLSGRGGGWPLSMFLTHDREPFHGGTYFPPVRRHGMPAFREVLAALWEAWMAQRTEITAQAAEIRAAVTKHLTPTQATEDVRSEGAPGLDRKALRASVTRALGRSDRVWGGFGGAPKFPNTMTLDLLAIVGATGRDALAGEAREHLAVTLDRMNQGGIHDHLGGGFSRYSTDARWVVPHFEKMLYDNAQIARLYLDAARMFSSGDDKARGEGYRAVVRDVLGYVLREMTSPEGTFYSAQDADSEGEEGKYFVWSPEGVAEAVGEADARVVCAWYDVTAEGNFEDGRSVLWTPKTAIEVSQSLGISLGVLTETLARARAQMLAVRSSRPRPALDDKCLAGWNALAIGTLADAGATLGEASWLDAAVRGLNAWRDVAWRGGRLAHAIRHGVAYGSGYLDDYAGLACAAVDVYEATRAPTALAFGRALGDAILGLFIDEATGVPCYSPADGEVVLVRGRDARDHAYPGGVGLALDALLRLAALTGDARYRNAAERALGAAGATVREDPMGAATVHRAGDRAASGTVDVVIVGAPERADTRAFCTVAREVYIPHRMLVVARGAEDARDTGLDPALLAGRSAGADGAPRAYVCRGETCALPVETAHELRVTLERAVRGD